MSSCVLVSGGSGFLGSWCVQVLLARGYTVHTTVRSAEKAAFLKSIPGASERLKVFAGVDLLATGAFEEAMTGCDAVLHTASPFFFSEGTEEKLVVPAVSGTRNVLSTCRKLGVKKVVLTSSTASVYANYGTLSADHVYTDKDWSPTDTLRENSNWYCLSKTAAEQAAWEMSREEGCPFELAVMCPTLIFGPQLPGQQHLNTSSSAVVGYFDGSMPSLADCCKTLVDVRDVAEAHVAAIERSGALGKRYLLISCSPHSRETADCVRQAVPEHMRSKVPTDVNTNPIPTVYAQPAPLPILYDTSPSVDILGIKYIGLAEMVKASVDTLLANGFDNNSLYSTDKL